LGVKTNAGLFMSASLLVVRNQLQKVDINKFNKSNSKYHDAFTMVEHMKEKQSDTMAFFSAVLFFFSLFCLKR